jgi:REP element-mobilizing transposase RayT
MEARVVRKRSNPATGNQDTDGSGKHRGAGVPPAIFFPSGSGLTIRSRRLPHWEAEGAVYFVTFRLADSLPKDALREVLSRREDIVLTAAQAGRWLTLIEARKLRQLHARRLERALDAGEGRCLLRNPGVAQAVARALKEFEASRYRLFAWCIMPNHVHVLFQPSGTATLASILHSWKSFSAKAANRILGRTGEFWQREYYDHLIRDADEFKRAVHYIVLNPRKAGLENWPWVWSYK